MLLTKSILVILPTGKEYLYRMEGEHSDPDIEAIVIYSNNITINYKNRGPVIWITSNLAGFSHDKNLVEVQKDPYPEEDTIDETETTPPAVHGPELV